MSNDSIILRLENKLADFISNKISKYEFTNYLINYIEALEAVSYDVIETARDFQFKFEDAEFFEEDEEIEPLNKVISDFKKWLGTLK